MAYSVKIMNEHGKEILNIESNINENLKDLLVNKGIIDFPCGGKGTCGKCKVKIKEKLKHTEDELKVLKDEEIDNNIHLACKVKCITNLTIETKDDTKFSVLSNTNIKDVNLNPAVKLIDITDIKEKIKNSPKSYLDILSGYLKSNEIKLNNISSLNIVKKLKVLKEINNEKLNLVTLNNEAINIINGDKRVFGIAVDIGTTTVAMYLFDLLSGKIVDSISSINPQRTFGYDVISRINYADNADKVEELQKVIINELIKMIDSLLKKHSIHTESLIHGVIVGNTIMSHLFVGADVESFGKAPFSPMFLETLTFKAKEIGFNKLDSTSFTLVNNISSFVGGDLIAGIIDTDLDRSEKYNFLIDIGTNGEMILANKDKVFCCATAAGPAFEAANISCGVGSVEGAICKVYKEKDKIKYETIGNKHPVGICGTGLIDLVAYLLNEEIIDETGYLEDNFVIAKDINNKDITITPKDIRELQLAKAAIAAGIDCLIEEVGLTFGNIDNFYVAGGFGNYLNIDSAIRIGLIPNIKDKLKAVGNSAGSGACKILLDKKLLNKCNEMVSKFNYIELSSSKSFMDKYIQNMYLI